MPRPSKKELFESLPIPVYVQGKDIDEFNAEVAELITGYRESWESLDDELQGIDKTLQTEKQTNQRYKTEFETALEKATAEKAAATLEIDKEKAKAEQLTNANNTLINKKVSLERQTQNNSKLSRSSLSTDDRKNVQIKPDRYFGPAVESYSQWRKAFLNLKDINNWSEAMGIRLGFAAMYKDARIATTHLDPEDFATTEEFLEELGKLFEPPATGEVARMAFDRISQQPTETILEYSNRMRAAFVKAYPSSSVNEDSILLRSFMHGLCSERVKTHTFRAKPTNYQDAIEAAMCESALLHSENLHTSNKDRRYIMPAITTVADDTSNLLGTATLGAISKGRRPSIARQGTRGHKGGARGKYCSHHKVNTHNTLDCRALKSMKGKTHKFTPRRKSENRRPSRRNIQYNRTNSRSNFRGRKTARRRSFKSGSMNAMIPRSQLDNEGETHQGHHATLTGDGPLIDDEEWMEGTHTMNIQCTPAGLYMMSRVAPREIIRQQKNELHQRRKK